MNDPTYYNNNKLIRPYRVGVTCGACHIAPNPVNPPLDPENPRWENLASAIGNQYINEGKVFCNLEKNSFFYEMFAARRVALPIFRALRPITSTTQVRSIQSS